MRHCAPQQRASVGAGTQEAVPVRLDGKGRRGFEQIADALFDDGQFGKGSLGFECGG